MTVAWNTNVANEVNLAGGELRALITNAGAGGISGHGLLSAPVVNTTFIAAESGTLLVETAANNNDWDGATENGQLRAILGNLEIRDNAGFLFDGDVIANQNHEVFVNGFGFDFAAASTLALNSGTYRSNAATNFGGTMTVAAPIGGDSALRISGLQATFQNGSATTLNGNLLLDNTSTVVQVGADFTGGAALINLAGRRLLLSDGVLSGDFNVLLINQGLLHLGALGADGQVQGKDFQQTGTGTLHIDLGGVALNAFDRFNLTGAATLSGALDLALIGGFVPCSVRRLTS